MCGRITLTADPEIIQMAFALDSIPGDYRPRYNIAPTQPVLALTNEGGREAQYLRWGLIPSWSKDPRIGSRLINARAETLAEKPSFRSAFRRRRCVIFADGFYEWQRVGKHKRPMYIRLHEGEPFALAGLWEVWKPPTGDEWLRTCTIITTPPNAFLASIHNRMPAILDRAAVERWLTPGELPPAELMPLLRPYPDEAALSAYEVSRLINSPANDSPACIEPVNNGG